MIIMPIAPRYSNVTISLVIEPYNVYTNPPLCTSDNLTGERSFSISSEELLSH